MMFINPSKKIVNTVSMTSIVICLLNILGLSFSMYSIMFEIVCVINSIIIVSKRIFLIGKINSINREGVIKSVEKSDITNIDESDDRNKNFVVFKKLLFFSLFIYHNF